MVYLQEKEHRREWLEAKKYSGTTPREDWGAEDRRVVIGRKTGLSIQI
jgi:hypothetical protein